MPFRNVHLTEHCDRFIETGINSGRFSNASEVVSEGLSLLEHQEQGDQAMIDWLRAATNEATGSIDRGEGTSFETIDDLAAFVHQIGREVSVGVVSRRRRR